MPSRVVWNSFARYTRWSESLWSPPIRFHQGRRTLVGASKGSLRTWYIVSAMVILTGALTSTLLLKNIFSSNLQILEIVFLLFYVVMSILILVLIHCTLLLRPQIIAVVNQIFNLDSNFGRIGFADVVGWDTVGYLMNVFLVMSSVTPALLAVFGVYENIDALFLFLVQFMDSSTISSSFPLTILRFGWLLLAVTEVWKQVGFFSLSCLLVLQIISKALGIKTNPASLMTYTRKGRRRLQIQWKFHQAYKIYQKLQLIIFSGLNPTLYFFIPAFMAFGLVLCILTDFTTIVLHDQMNFALLVVMPGISFGVKFIIMTVLPLACQVHEEALKFSRDWRKVAPIRNALSRRMLRCILPLRIYAGPFFYCQQSTKTRYFSVIMYYTITAVISIESIER